jgi:phosphatidylglycerophosphate synthase
VPPVRIGPIIGLIGQVALLAALATGVGLGARGWVTGVAYGLILCGILTHGLHVMAVRFGPADWVTLTRATLVGCVAALTFEGPARAGLVVGIATAALILDAVDGKIARRTSTESRFGARFDMEIDAFLIFVLSIYVAPSAGWWVLAIGGMRYAYVVAGWALPSLRSTVPPRYWRKVVAAIQGIVLVVAAADVLFTPVMDAALAVALALLIESFGRDIIWQLRRPQLGVHVARAPQRPETIEQLH